MGEFIKQCIFINKLRLTASNPNLLKGDSMIDLDLYKEGSEVCRNYSRLTMQVRTLTQQVLMATVAAVAVAILAKGTLSDQVDHTFLGYILLCTGIVLGSFSASLALIDWHYQSAFTAIRDALVELEKDAELIHGPWQAHKKVRTSPDDFIASYVPFWFLSGIGLIGFINGCTITGCNPIWMIIVGILIFVFGLFTFVYIGIKSYYNTLKIQTLNNVNHM